LVYEEDREQRKKKREKGGEQKVWQEEEEEEEECRHKKIHNFTQASGHRKRKCRTRGYSTTKPTIHTDGREE